MCKTDGGSVKMSKIDYAICERPLIDDINSSQLGEAQSTANARAFPGNFTNWGLSLKVMYSNWQFSTMNEMFVPQI